MNNTLIVPLEIKLPFNVNTAIAAALMALPDQLLTEQHQALIGLLEEIDTWDEVPAFDTFADGLSDRIVGQLQAILSDGIYHVDPKITRQYILNPYEPEFEDLETEVSYFELALEADGGVGAQTRFASLASWLCRTPVRQCLTAWRRQLEHGWRMDDAPGEPLDLSILQTKDVSKSLRRRAKALTKFGIKFTLERRSGVICLITSSNLFVDEEE